LISLSVNARKSNFDGSTSPLVTLIRHFLQVPYPPHVESIPIPFQEAASNALTPVGTVIVFCDPMDPSFSSDVKASLTRPVPSWAGIRDGSNSFLLIINSLQQQLLLPPLRDIA
jgi:hypothetical protein